jgi:hypothetical protein
MDKMPLVALIFQGIPECIVYIALGSTLAGAPLRRPKVVAAGVILALVLYFVRSLPLPYGVHTLTGVITAWLLIFLFFRTPPLVAATASLLTGTFLLCLEIILFPLAAATGSSLREIWNRPALRILLALPQLTVMSLATWFCVRKKINIVTPWAFSQKAEGEKKTENEDGGRRP